MSDQTHELHGHLHHTHHADADALMARAESQGFSREKLKELFKEFGPIALLILKRLLGGS